MAGTAKRVMQLDVLRGVAVLLVMGRHAAVSPYDAGLLKYPAGLWFRMGWSGVDLFFVLSGFLVGGLLLGEIRARGELDVKRFLIRRGFKIWPGYFVYLAAAFAYLWLSQGLSLSSAFAKIAPNLIHIQNYMGAFIVVPLPHTWSLAVEEHFYLALPLALVLAVGRRERPHAIPGLVRLSAGALVACLAVRLYTYFTVPYEPTLLRWPTHDRIDSLFVGVLLSYLSHFHPERFRALARRRRGLLAMAAVLLTPLLLKEDNGFVVTVGFTLIAVGYASLLLVVVTTQPDLASAGGLRLRWPTRVLAYIGVYSYSIYLWHILAGRLPATVLAGSAALAFLRPEAKWVVVMGVYVLLGLGAGIIMGKAIELPALRLRERLFPATPQAAAAHLA